MPNALHLYGCVVRPVQLTGKSDNGALRVYTNYLQGKEIFLTIKGVQKYHLKEKNTHTFISDIFLPSIFINITIHCLPAYFALWALLLQLPRNASDGAPCAGPNHHHVDLACKSEKRESHRDSAWPQQCLSFVQVPCPSAATILYVVRQGSR